MATTTKKSSVSVKAKNATVTKSNYDKTVAKYGQAKVDSAMKKNNMTIGGDSSGSSNSSKSSKNTPQQEANIAKANAFKASGSNTVTTTPIVKKTAQQEANIAKANAFKASQQPGYKPGNILQPVNMNILKNKNLIEEAISKKGVDAVEAALNKGNRSLYKDGVFMLEGNNKYATKSGAIRSDIYNDGAPNTELAVEKTNTGMELSIDEQAKKKAEVIEDTAEEERKAQEEANREKKERAEAREKEAKQIFNEYNKDSEASKKAIEENLAAIKRTQTIAANAAAAQAGQGAGLSEGARQQLEADIANRAAANINTATGSAIEQTQGITESQKTAGMQGLTEQDKVDTLKNTLSDSEWNIFIKSIQEVGLAKTLAKDKYANFIYEQNVEVSGEMLQRKLRELKTAQNKDIFLTGKRQDKIEYMDSQLKDVPGYNNFKTKTYELIDKGLELEDIIATISGLAQAQYDSFQLTSGISIQDKSILSKAAKDLSDSELERLLELRKK